MEIELVWNGRNERRMNMHETYSERPKPIIRGHNTHSGLQGYQFRKAKILSNDSKTNTTLLCGVEEK